MRVLFLAWLLLLIGGTAYAQNVGSRPKAGQQAWTNKANIFTKTQQIQGLGIGPAVVAPSIPTSSFGSAPVWACAEGTPPTLLPGLDSLWCDNTGGFMFSRNAGLPVRLVGTSSGTNEFPISGGTNTFGNNTGTNSYATGAGVVSYRAVNNCHFVWLLSQNVWHAATCSTPPTFNVFTVGWAGNAGVTNNGTAGLASATLQARGVATITKETLPIAAGDIYGIYVSLAGGTCVTDEFIPTAEIACP